MISPDFISLIKEIYGLPRRPFRLLINEALFSMEARKAELKTGLSACTNDILGLE